jgi:hypothetical protein
MGENGGGATGIKINTINAIRIMNINVQEFRVFHREILSNGKTY